MLEGDTPTWNLLSAERRLLPLLFVLPVEGTVQPRQTISLLSPPTPKMLERGTTPWTLPSNEGRLLPLDFASPVEGTAQPCRIISLLPPTAISTAAAVVQFVGSAVAAAATATGNRAGRRSLWPVGRSGQRGDAGPCP